MFRKHGKREITITEAVAKASAGQSVLIAVPSLNSLRTAYTMAIDICKKKQLSFSEDTPTSIVIESGCIVFQSPETNISIGHHVDFIEDDIEMEGL